MATINLGSIKFKWKGTYAGGTAYTVDDVVEYNGSSYICILASTGNLPTNATYFEQMSSAGTNGTDGTDLTSTLTTQGDLLYRDGSGLQRLAKGTAGQTLIMNSGATAPEWGAGGGDMTPSFFAYRDDTLSLASVTETTIGFNLEKFDTDNAYDTSTYKFTVPSGKGGKYFLFCHLRKNNFSGNRFYWQMNRDISGGSTGNAIITAENTHYGDSYVSNFAQTIYQLGAGDAIYIRAYHNDSGSRELTSDESACYFGGYRLAD
jgi:hypothetical protein